MPAQSPLPTIAELTRAYGDGVRAERDPNVDAHSGSAHDLLAGTSAILAAREAVRDRDLFRQSYFDTAEGLRLYDFAKRRFGVDAIRAARGVGFVDLERASTGGTDIPHGSRIALDRNGKLAIYEVDGNHYATQTTARVPIRATDIGPGYAADVSEDARVVDLLPARWRVVRLVCADGTLDEDPATLRDRARTAQRRRRRGLREAITDVANAEGAAFVALFASTYQGPEADSGISAAYIGAPGLVLDMDLVRRVAVRLDDVRVAGADLMVRPMVGAALKVVARGELSGPTERMNVDAIRRAVITALLASFDARESPYLLRLSALEGAAIAATGGAITSLAFSQPATDVSVSPRSWPATLTRWSLRDADIDIRF